jgi:hypothetical protein
MAPTDYWDDVMLRVARFIHRMKIWIYTCRSGSIILEYDREINPLYLFSAMTDKSWSEWFAWFPVEIDGEARWLEKVYRREVRHGFLTDISLHYRYDYTDLIKILRGDWDDC